MISLLRPLRRGSVRAAVAGALTATALMISSPAHAATSTYEYSFSGPANHSETATGEPGDTGLCSPVETITFQGKFSVHVAATQPGLSAWIHRFANAVAGFLTRPRAWRASARVE